MRRQRDRSGVKIGDPGVLGLLKQAETRIGDTIPDRLRWLLRFQAEDLSRLSDRRAQRLGWELIAFALPLGRAPQFPLLGPLSFPASPSKTEIQTFQRDLRTGLELLFRKQGAWTLKASVEMIEVNRWPDELVTVGTGATEAGLKGRPLNGPPGASAGNRIDVRYHVRWPDSFWAAVASALSLGAWWLRLCRRCGNLFIGTKRQEYCRKVCSQAVRTEQFRARKREGRDRNRSRRQAK